MLLIAKAFVLDDIVPWPTDDQAIACLRGGDQDANLIWRPNPDFPYIYVSFSYNQLAQAYLLDFYPQEWHLSGNK